MKIIIAYILIIVVSVISINSQNIEQPKLVDEFGSLPLGDLLGRLDVLGVEIHRNKESTALIKISGGRKARSFYVFPYTWGVLMNTYLVGNRKFDAEKIKIQNCDLAKENVEVEFFIVPKNYEIPECNDELFVPDETVSFYFEHFENPYIVYDYPYEIAGAGEATSQISNKILLELLNKSPDSKVFLIGYLGSNRYSNSEENRDGEWESIDVRKPDKLELMKKMLDKAEQKLIKSGINASKIVKINGGYRDTTRSISIYFVPKNGEIPKPEPDYFPKKSETK